MKHFSLKSDSRNNTLTGICDNGYLVVAYINLRMIVIWHGDKLIKSDYDEGYSLCDFTNMLKNLSKETFV